MKKVIQRFFLFFIPIFFIAIKTFAQCSPNNIEFVGGEIIYNSACGDNSYQVIKGSNLPNASFKWEVSYSGSAFQTVVNLGNVPISSSDLTKNDITNFILNKNAKASGDYRIRRVATDASIACLNTSDPVFLYYAEDQSRLSGGSISNLTSINCSPASGTLLLTGQTGPVLQWETSLDGVIWTSINNITNTLNYSNISTPTYYRALVDNICDGAAGSIDILDKYSSTYLILLTNPPSVSDPISTTICQGSILNLSVTATSSISVTYQWRKDGISILGANSANLIIANADLSDEGSYDVVVSNTCGSTISNPASVNITTIPNLNVPSSVKICAGTNLPETVFTSDDSSVTYTWTNSNIDIGLALNGTGNLPSFIAKNTTNAPITAIIRVIPSIGSCSGSEYSFSITVDPLPQINNYTDIEICAGEIVTSTNFITTIPGTTLTWTNSNTNIGLAASGIGNIPSFYATNTSAIVAEEAVITVTPSLNGCVGSPISYKIKVNPITIIVSELRKDESNCDSKDGEISISATGTSPLEYSIDGGITWQISPLFTGLGSGTYLVAVKNANNCITLGSTLSISSPGAPPQPILESYLNSICEGESLTLKIDSPDPLATYNWTGPNGFNDTGTEIKLDLANLSMSGEYAVTATINLCISEAKIIDIMVNPKPIINPVSDLVFCNGDIVPDIIFNSNLPNTTFKWANNNTDIGLISSGNTKIDSFTAINDGNAPIIAEIEVTPESDGCNGEPITFKITVNPSPKISEIPDIEECAGTKIEKTIFTSSVSGTTFSWTNSNPSIGLKASGDGDIPEFISINNTKSVKEATITVFPIVNGCIGNAETYKIRINPLPSLSNSILSQSICSGATTTAVILGSDIPGTSLKWTFLSASPNLSGYITGSGTNQINAQTIINNSQIEGTITYQISPILNGCEGISNDYTIKVYPLPTAEIKGSAQACYGAISTLQVNLTGKAPWTIVYSDGTTSQTISNILSSVYNFNVIADGTKKYTITSVIDANACSGIGTGEAIITQPSAAISASFSFKNISCYGLNDGSIKFETVTGGFGTYEYSIDGGINWQNSAIFNGLSTGNYLVSVRDASLTQCVSIIYPEITISQPAAALSSNELQTNVACFGGSDGSAKIIPNGGTAPYSFSWSNGASSDEITNLKSGIYKVTVRDANNCTIEKEFTITEPSAALSINESQTNVSCFGGSDGSIKIIPNGGTAPYSFSWSNGASSDEITNLKSGTYKVSIRDANNCEIDKEFTINEPIAALSINEIQTNVSCFGGSDGSIKIIPNGGTSPYIFNWSNGESSGEISNLKAGTYKVNIIDANLCTIDKEFTIIEPIEALSINKSQTNVSCFEGSDGSIKIIPRGGTSPYTFKWSNGEIGDAITNLKAGNYTITVNDSKNCEYLETITISAPSAALKITVNKSDASCFNVADGSIKTIVSGGTAPYSYLWSNGESTADIYNLEGEKYYSVTIIDANGCTVSENIRINKPDLLKASLTVKNTTCKTSSDGMVSATIVGGTAPYALKWIGSAQTNNLIDNLSAGKYELTITDSNGCILTVSADVLPGNCAPVAIDDYYTTDQEVNISGTVAANDFDRQGENLEFKITGSPKNGSITLKKDGEFVYKPNPDFWGIEQIEYETCNTSGLCAKAILKIDVLPFTIVSLTPSLSTVSEGKKVSINAKLLRPFKDDVIIKLSYSGVALKNKDYVLLDQFIEIRIPKGQISSTEKITIAALTDDELEGQENIKIEIISSSDPLVRIGSGAIVIIEDNYPIAGTIPTNEDNKFPINPDIKPDPLVSPNDDGLGNDFFKIENIISFPDNLVLIFNRWGNEVFRLEGYNESDRIFKGFANTGLLTNTNTPLSEGVYYYLIKTKRTVLGQKIEALNKGYLILKR